MSKSLAFKSPLRRLGATATASVPDTSRETESQMEISMASDLTHDPSTTSPSHQPAAVTITTAEDPVLDQFQQMRSMISSFLGVHQDSTPNPRQSTISPLRLNTWRSETFRPSEMRYSTRLKNTRNRPQQINRSQHFKFLKQHRLPQDVKIHLHHTRYSTSFCTSYAVNSDNSSTRTSNSYCKSSTIEISMGLPDN